MQREKLFSGIKTAPKELKALLFKYKIYLLTSRIQIKYKFDHIFPLQIGISYIHPISWFILLKYINYHIIRLTII